MTPSTLQDLAAVLPARGRRRAVGVRSDFAARWWTYRELYEAACAAADLLFERGVEPGQRIVVWSGNRPEWVACLLGAALRGAVVVPVDEGASVEHARRIADEVRAVLVLHGEEQDGAQLGLPAQAMHAVGPGRGGSHKRWQVPVEPDAEAVILFTSGTTARPKGVILSHRNLVSQMQTIKLLGGVGVRTGRVRLLALAPLSHSQGLLLGLCIPLWVGLTVLYSSSSEPTHLVRAIRDCRVTMLATVPRVVQTLAATLRRSPWNGRSGRPLEVQLERIRRARLRRLMLRRSVHRQLGNQFRLLFVGGADLSRTDEEFWRDSRCAIIQGYGLTETAAIVSVNRLRGGRLGSIGTPLAHTTVELAPDGEILVRGPNVAAGYLGDRPEGSESLEDGVLRTGDLAVQDDQKRLYFVGRKKDVIVTSEGFNVYPDEVETVLREIPGVRDAVVMAREHEGTVGVHASLLLESGGDVGRVVQRANRKLESHQLIRSWSVYPDEDFPRTSLLKVKRAEVAARLREPDAAEERPELTLDEILALGDRPRRLQLLAAHLASGAPSRNGNGHARPTLRELGLTSLETVELLGQIEARTGVPLDRVEVPPDAGLDDLSRIVTDQGAMAENEKQSRLPVGPPKWSRRRLGRLVRMVSQPVIGRLWARRWGRPVVTLPAGLQIPEPVIVAAAPHRHYFDGLAILHALPRRVRRRLVVVTNYRFDEQSAPTRATGRRRRQQIRRMYNLKLPMAFDFVILPHHGTTRHGLYDLGRLIEGGFSPLTFPKGLYMSQDDLQRHDPGVAMIAVETQTPVLPVWLERNDGWNGRPDRSRPVRVRVGEVIPVTPAMTREELIERMECAFGELERGGAGA